MFKIVLQHSLRVATIGCAIGIVGSIVVGRLLATVLYGGASSQPFITVAVAVLLAAVAAAAAAGPARRASRVDPIVALRNE